MSSIVRNLNCIVDYILRHVLKKLIAYVLIYVLAILYGVLVLVRVLLKVLREGTQILKTSPPMEQGRLLFFITYMLYLVYITSNYFLFK